MRPSPWPSKLCERRIRDLGSVACGYKDPAWLSTDGRRPLRDEKPCGKPRAQLLTELSANTLAVEKEELWVGGAYRGRLHRREQKEGRRVGARVSGVERRLARIRTAPLFE